MYIAKSYGLTEVADYWEQVIIFNDHQKKRFAEKIVKTLYNTVSDKKIAILGWAFKKDTNDTRETPAVYVSDYLLNEKSILSVYDPKVMGHQIQRDLNYLGTRTVQENKDNVSVNSSPYETCENAHAIAILTEWDEFKTLDWQRIYDNMMKPAFVFDGRGILDHELLKDIGFNTYTIGYKEE